MNEVKPCLTVLTEEQVQTVHENALAILEKTGIRIDDENCRDMFTKAVGTAMATGVLQFIETWWHGLLTALRAV